MSAVNRERSAVWGKIGRLLTLALVLFLLAEAGSRLWLHQLASDAAFLRFASWRQLSSRSQQPRPLAISFAAHRYVGYLPAADGAREPNRHSLRGFRGEEVRGAGGVRIVCVGGSDIYSVGVIDWRESFPAQLERRLIELGWDGVEVINAGVPGWSSWEMLVDYSLRIDALKPDILVVGLPADDVDARLVWPAGAYQPDNAGWRSKPVEPIWMPAFWEHSTLLRTGMILLGRLPSHASYERTLDAPVATAHARAFERELAEGSYPQGIFEWAAADRMLHVNSPHHLRRNLERLLILASAEETQTVLLAMGNTPDLSDPRSWSAEYLTAFAEHDGVARSVAATSGSPYLLADEAPPDGALQGLVWTAEGNRWRAARVAESLERLMASGGSNAE